VISALGIGFWTDDGPTGSYSGETSRSGRLRERGADALAAGCPKTRFLNRSQVTDSAYPEFLILDAHKELFFGQSFRIRAADYFRATRGLERVLIVRITADVTANKNVE
jgi:hypothetical protein